MRAPHHTHTRSPPSLDAGDTVLEDKTLFPLDFLLALFSQAAVDCFEGEEVDVRGGFAFSRWDARVVAEDFLVVREVFEQAVQVRGLEVVICRMAACCEGEIHAAFAEGFQEFRHAREGLGGGEMLALQFGDATRVFGAGDGKLGPGVEDLAGFGARAALQLGFDVPGEIGPVVFTEDDVVAECVHVFGVEE